MPDTFDIPEEVQKHLSEKDRDRVDHVDRNVQIRKAYESLLEKHGRPIAFQKLAQRHNVQPSTVKAIVYEQR